MVLKCVFDIQRIKVWCEAYYLRKGVNMISQELQDKKWRALRLVAETFREIQEAEMQEMLKSERVVRTGEIPKSKFKLDCKVRKYDGSVGKVIGIWYDSKHNEFDYTVMIKDEEDIMGEVEEHLLECEIRKLPRGERFEYDPCMEFSPNEEDE